EDEGAVADGSARAADFDLEREGERLEKRLRFLSTVARLWQIAARFLVRPGGGGQPPPPALLRAWPRTARANRGRLLALLDAIHGHALPEPSGDYDSLVEYDRRRVLKDQLLYAAIGTCLDTSLAIGALRGALARLGGPAEEAEADAPAWEPFVLRL